MVWHLEKRVPLGTEAKRAVGLPEVVVLEDLLSVLSRAVHRRSLQVVLGVDLHRRQSINAAVDTQPHNEGKRQQRQKITAGFMRQAEGCSCRSVEAAQRYQEPKAERVIV